MIRMTQSRSADQAKSYFNDGLQKADYYIKDQELQGNITGRLADRLGLTGPATKEVFYALADNKYPDTGQTLTRHHKGNRTAGYDLTFLPPKSVSIAALLTPGGDRIITAFEQSVSETLKIVEEDVTTRVRMHGVNADRKTGELIIAGFTHLTSRPTEGNVADPFLHHHAYLFNATYDAVEKKIKAAKFNDIMSNVSYYNALFTKTLADRLVKLGYDIRQEKNSFEISGISNDAIRLFSKRREQILKFAKQHGIDNKNDLAAKTRSKKQKGLSMEQLKEDWRRQLKDKNLEIPRFENHQSREITLNPYACRDIIDKAFEHCFERASVVSQRVLLREASRLAIGQTDVTPEQLQAMINCNPDLYQVSYHGEVLCTTSKILREEKQLVDLAKQMGFGTVKPISLDVDLDTSDQQERAINGILTSTHRICIIKGAAGSGKTTLMKKAISRIEETGKNVTVVAPTASASRNVLRQEGHKDADTISKLLTDKNMQAQLRSGVLWVDEAGMIGTRQMLDIVTLVKEKNARLILGGDYKQHSSISRGDAMRVLKEVAGVPTAEITIIRRQRNEMYKSVVGDLAQGNIQSGFNKLDSMGSIKTMDGDTPYARIADRYINAIKEKRSVLMVSPTHNVSEEVSKAIRERLRQEKKLGKREVNISRLVNLNLTAVDKGLIHNYQRGQVVQFNQNSTKIPRGSAWVVSENDGRKVELQNESGEIRTLPLNHSDRFDLFDIKVLPISKGDKVRVTRNSFEHIDLFDSNNKKGKRMDNGLELVVTGVSVEGNIKAINKKSKIEYRFDKHFGHLDHDYCSTSHGSQGKTCDEVVVVQPSETFGATNAKQFYVSVSRAKHLVSIYTDDKDALLKYASKAGDRLSAIELVNSRNLDIALTRKKRLERDVVESREFNNEFRRQKQNSYEPSI